MSVRRFLFRLAAVSGVVASVATGTNAQEYTLAPGDTVEVSVFARPDLSRNYRVRVDGTISLHLVGPILAENLSPAQLEAEIETRLSDSVEQSISATVEVANWRPMTVAGDVTTPGSIPFQPGATVRSAIAVAGGVLRQIELDGLGVSSQMNVQAEIGRVAFFKARLASLISERDRLQNEANQIEPTDGPVVLDAVVELVGEETAQTLAELEYNFRQAQLEVRALAISSQDVQVSLAEREAQAFEDRRIIVGDQLKMTLAQVEKEDELVRRGLKRAEDLFLLQSTASQLRADALEALGLESEARQKLERALASQNVEDVQRQDVIANRLTNLESEILATKVQLEESRAFVVKFGGGSALDSTNEPLEQYEIFRTVNGEVLQMAAELETKLFPGDLLSVTVLTER